MFFVLKLAITVPFLILAGISFFAPSAVWSLLGQERRDIWNDVVGGGERSYAWFCRIGAIVIFINVIMVWFK